MKKLLVLIYFGLMLTANLLPLSMPKVQASPANLIANPSVETTDPSNPSQPQSWLQGNWGTNTTSFSYPSVGHTGSKSVRVQISSYTSGDAKWYFSPVAITGGTQYDFSDYYESSIVSDVVAQFDDGTGKYTYVDYGNQPASDTNWTQTNLNFTAPATAKYVTIFHLINNVGWLQTDDYSLTALAASPTVSISSPTANSTVAGTVQLSANASSPSGVGSVQFQLDGVNFGNPVTAAPYQLNWDTTKLINGIHSIGAIMTTTDNQQVAATPVSVTVSNANLTGGNIVPNPSVEMPDSTGKAPQGWSKGSWGTNSTSFNYVTNAGHSGTHSLKVQMSSYSSGASYWYFAPQPVLPNQQYDFKDYFMTNVITEVDAGINLSDGTTQYLYLGSTYPSKSDWTKFEIQFTAPANAVSITIYHSIYSVGWLQTDDFSLSPYTTVGFKRPIISIDFDDGWESFYKNGLPLLNKYGFKSTDFIISGYLGDPEYVTATQVKALYAQGNEIGSHTVDHPDLTTLSATKLDSELKNSQTTLQKTIGAPVTDFASPYGAYNQTVINNIKQYYASHRGVESGFNAKSNFDPYDIKVQNMVSTTTLAQVESWVQQAQATNTWLVLVYHQVDSSLDKTTEPYNTYQSDLDAQLAYIKSTGISVETTAQALAEITPQL